MWGSIAQLSLSFVYSLFTFGSNDDDGGFFVDERFFVLGFLSGDVPQTDRIIGGLVMTMVMMLLLLLLMLLLLLLLQLITRLLLLF